MSRRSATPGPRPSELDPALKVNQPAVDALVQRFDPELFGAGKRGSVGPIRGDRDKKGAIAPQ